MHLAHPTPCHGRQRTEGLNTFTIPEPDTKTLLPRVTPALLQAWIPTERGSIRAPSSKVTLSGSLKEPDTSNITEQVYDGDEESHDTRRSNMGLNHSG